MTISEEEFDSISKRNVEKWISAHIIPVRSIRRGLITESFNPLTQESPITLESKTYPTLLHRKTVSFTALPKSDPKAAEWTRVLVNGDVHIIAMREVRRSPQSNLLNGQRVSYCRFRLSTVFCISLMAPSQLIDSLNPSRNHFICRYLTFSGIVYVIRFNSRTLIFASSLQVAAEHTVAPLPGVH